MSPIELETKLVVSASDHRAIMREGRVLECRDQLNVYLHDPARVKEEMGYLRVRFETGGEPTATLKVPVGWRGTIREMMEVERPLSEMGRALFPRPRRWVIVDPNVPEGFMEHFQAMGIRRLRRLGWMRNHRCVVGLGSVGAVELDRTVLPGGRVHHEVEIEHPSEGTHEALVQRVRSIAPSAEFSRVGKFALFLSAMGLA